MINRKVLIGLLAGIATLTGCLQRPTADGSGVEQRVNDLLDRMTLEEKIGQMMQITPYGDPDVVKDRIRDGQAGSILNVVGAKEVNELQKVAVEESRLGIPLLVGRDVIHGFKTIFPIPLGMAASWNEDLIRESAAIAAKESAAMGIRWTFAPMIDVSRDPRWGRIAESAGEDPLLNAMMARAMVQGFQGEDMSRPDRIAACIKHYVGYGAAEGGRDYNTTWIPDIYMHNIYLPPFKEGVKAGAATVMTAFNDINGVPASGNQYTIRQVLKESYGFDGLVISDWGSIQEMIAHGYVANDKEAAQRALAAGVDMEMATFSYVENLKMLLDEGEVKMEWIDDAVKRILRVKFQLGLFEHPYTDEGLAERVLLAPPHLELAQQLAEESVVLLKNNNNLLPLKKGTQIALIGPLANEAHEQMGTWVFDGSAENSITVLQAMKTANGANNIHFAEGLAFSRDMGSAKFGEVERAIAKSDVVVAVMGEESILSGEAKSLAELRFPGKQEELLRLASAKGKPVVMVVMAGRPTGLARVQNMAGSILYAWHPGTMAGPALANLIFGDAVPSGRLPVTFPKGEGQIPIYYAHKNTGRPTNEKTWDPLYTIPVHAVQHSTGNTTHTLDYGYTPLYPFGYGLSYTTFEYDNTKLSSNEMDMNGTIVAKAIITNTGDRKATETVQCYIRDVVASYTRPVRELIAYQRVTLDAGESREISFELNRNNLGFYLPDGNYTTEKGEFRVWIAPNAEQGSEAQFRLK